MRAADLPPRLVVDASVGIKWVVLEGDSERAAAVVSGRELLTSGLFWLETANVLASKVRRGELDRAAATDAWRDLQAAPLTSFPVQSASADIALALAHDLQHPIYDCCYLALGLAERAPVLTADRRFKDTVSRHPALASQVILLAEIT